MAVVPTLSMCGVSSHYTAKEKAEIGKYAVENGPTQAARCFSEQLGHKVPESSARRFKSEYLQKLKAMARDRDNGDAIRNSPKFKIAKLYT